MSVCKDVTIGKILIQTNEMTGEPEVGRALNVMLPYTRFHLCLFLFHSYIFFDFPQIFPSVMWF